MERKIAVITGATSGIGFYVALGLLKKGFYVIGTGRSERRCDVAETALKSISQSENISFLSADLASQGEIQRLAMEIKNHNKVLTRGGLDVLIHNAATFSRWFSLTSEGIELQWAVNYLSSFLLSQLLLSQLSAVSDGRIIVTSSGSHFNTRIHWDDVLLRRCYSALWAYKQSKLALVLFAKEFNEKMKSQSGVRCFAVDPGLVATDIGLKGTSVLTKWVWKFRKLQGVPPERGAMTTVFVATENREVLGDHLYWKDSKPNKPSPYVYEGNYGKRLWTLSERMCDPFSGSLL